MPSRHGDRTPLGADVASRLAGPEEQSHINHAASSNHDADVTSPMRQKERTGTPFLKETSQGGTARAGVRVMLLLKMA